MKFFFFPACLTLITLFGSCSGKNKYSLQENSIDSLETVLASADQALKADTSVIRKRADKISYEMNAIKLYHADTIPRELAYRLDDYRKIRKLYAHYLQSIGPLNEETEALRTQLKKLRESLLKGKFSDDAFSKFYSIEKRDVEAHYAMSHDLAGKLITVDSVYNAVNPIIEKVVGKVTEGQVN